MIRYSALHGTSYAVGRSAQPGLIVLQVEDGPRDARAVLSPEHAMHIIRLLAEQLGRIEKERK